MRCLSDGLTVCGGIEAQARQAGCGFDLTIEYPVQGGSVNVQLRLAVAAATTQSGPA
jgi:hypothetical protein